MEEEKGDLHSMNDFENELKVTTTEEEETTRTLEESKKKKRQKRKKKVSFKEEKGDLLHFMNDFENELKTEEETTKTLEEESEKVKRKKKIEKEESLSLRGIEVILDNWLQQVLYVESGFTKSANLLDRINESLDRTRMDGFLSIIEFEELKSIGKLWYELFQLTSCYNMGVKESKRRIIEVLVTLYSLKQLNIVVFLDTCTQL